MKPVRGITHFQAVNTPDPMNPGPGWDAELGELPHGDEVSGFNGLAILNSS
jgi:hypothetical protein